MHKIKNRGFTLVEMLLVLLLMSLMAAIAIPSVKTAFANREEKRDMQTVEEYSRAVKNYAITDYTAVVIYKNNDLIEDGQKIDNKIVYSKIEGLTNNEIIALNNAGKGVYPKTRDAVTASIKIYGLEIKHPERLGYSFYYNSNTKGIEVHEVGYKATGYICIDR